MDAKLEFVEPMIDDEGCMGVDADRGRVGWDGV